jgi:hypothetical protein
MATSTTTRPPCQREREVARKLAQQQTARETYHLLADARRKLSETSADLARVSARLNQREVALKPDAGYAEWAAWMERRPY